MRLEEIVNIVLLSERFGEWRWIAIKHWKQIIDFKNVPLEIKEHSSKARILFLDLIRTYEAMIWNKIGAASCDQQPVTCNLQNTSTCRTRSGWRTRELTTGWHINEKLVSKNSILYINYVDKECCKNEWRCNMVVKADMVCACFVNRNWLQQ